MMLDMGTDLDLERHDDRHDSVRFDDLPPDGAGDAPNGGRHGGGGDAATSEAPPRDAKRDLRNGWQVLAGSVLIPLGVVFIMLGWYGAAHARVVQQQIPYLVSGAFVGLGCMVVGGLMFFGHWLYRIYDQADLHHEEQQRLLETIAAALLAQRGAESGAVAVRPGAAAGIPVPAPQGAGGAPMYYATASGSVYHTADCAVIAHHPEDLRVLGSDGVAGMRACQICSPGPG